MIALDAGQAAIVAASAVDLVVLVRLTTYTNRAELTGAQDFWFASPHPVRYPWGGTDRDFRDVVDAVTFDGGGFAHLPEPAAARKTRARVTLLAETIDGANLWKTLDAANLLGAEVQIATLLVPQAKLREAAFWDLTDLAGTEHVVRFRGLLSGGPEVSDEIVNLEFTSDDPDIDWGRATDETEVDPRDIGRRYPVPFGSAKGVPCVNREVGWYTTLAQGIDSTTTGNVQVTDLTGAPAGSASYQLGGERITATKVSKTLLNITARGQSGSAQVPHNPGEPILELIAATVLVVAGKPIAGVDALYLVNASSGERTRVTTPYTVTLFDTGVDTGRNLTTIRFTADELAQLLDTTVAPTPAPEAQTVLIPLNTWSEEASGSVDSDSNALPGTKQIVAPGDEMLRATVSGAGDIPDPETRDVIRWRVRVSVTGQGGTDTFLRYRYNAFGNSTAGTAGAILYNFKLLAPETLTLTGAWVTPSSPQTLAAALSDYVEFWLDIHGGFQTADDFVTFANAWLEVEVEGEVETPPPSNLSASQGGLGLLFVADVQGVSLGTYITGYTWNEGTGWNLVNCTQSDLGASGQKFTSTGATQIDAQRNATAGVVDLSSGTDFDSYQLVVTGENVDKITTIQVYVSETTGAGTTIPTPFRQINFSGADLIEGAEAVLRSTFVADSVGPGMDILDVETIHIRFFSTDAISPFPALTVRLLEKKDLGTPVEDGHDVAQYFLEQMAGEEVDATSFSALGTALGADVFAGQFDTYGETLPEVIAGLGFDMRTNFRKSPVDGKWRAHAATLSGSDFVFPAIVRTLTTLDNLRESMKSIEEVATAFSAFWRLKRWEPAGNPESYDGLIVRDSGTEFDTARAKIGDREAEPMLFAGIEDGTTINNVAGFYVESRRNAGFRRWAVSVPLWDGYDLEPGDTVGLRPRWRDADAKARVLEVLLGSGEAAVGLVLEEVL